MIRLGRGSIVPEHSLLETIPGAAQRDVEYLRAVRRRVAQLGLPVTWNVDDVEGAGISRRTCLVVTPTDRRLRYYPMAHYAVAAGRMLQVGFYLLGGDRAEGGSLLGGAEFGIGRPTDADVSNVLALVETIFEHAVAPSIQELVDASGASDTPSIGGFFGS